MSGKDALTWMSSLEGSVQCGGIGFSFINIRHLFIVPNGSEKKSLVNKN